MGQWPDFGTPPHESAFGIHAAIATDYLHGGWYPKGGAKKIVLAAKAVIENLGGHCLVSHPVGQILVNNNKAYGVRVSHKGRTEEYFAPRIISNAGAHTTFRRLVPDQCATKEKSKLDKIKTGTSAVVLFLGLTTDPRSHGFTESNYWIYRTSNHRYRDRAHDGRVPVDGAFLSFGSLRNPGQTPHTAQIICFDQQSEWARYENSQWRKRGSDYEKKKQIKAEDLLQFVEDRVPGLRSLVAYQELATPLSFRDFTGHHQGAIYGHRCDSNRLSKHTWSISTSVKNLYQSGTDVCIPGINAALMIGVMAAGKLLGVSGLPRIMFAANRASKVHLDHRRTRQLYVNST